MNHPSLPSEPLLRQARRHLLEHGQAPATLADERLRRSWERCLAAGLRPIGRNDDVPQLTGSSLACLVEREHELVAHAQPVMEYLCEQVGYSAHTVVLADRHGTLLHAQGDPGFIARAERALLRPGASWHEQYRGTNAIGTALAERAPVEIHGGAHFLERNGFLTCAAAPILDPAGQLLGVLDISGDRRSRHPHTHGLVRSAAQMIENRLFASRHRHSIRLSLHPRAEGIGTLAEGIAAVSEDGWLIAANRTALQLLGLVPADLGATPLNRLLDTRLEDLLDWARRKPDLPINVRRRDGSPLYLHIHARPSLASNQPRPATPAPQTPPRDALSALDTGDTRLAAAIAKARRVLDKPIPLLLAGESGVGKELFAQAVHGSGPRRQQPFIAINCAALPENLIEAELFGYTPGAFTGARREGSPGRIREAHGGTLFLDEIGDMPLPLQARLLRVLQERQVTPLGGGKATPVDFALICASHRDLKAEVAAGRFRTDLYYRLNGLTLILPPLRERGDFPALCARLLAEQGKEPPTLAPAVARALAKHRWPGNLRQLANVLRAASAMLDANEMEIDWPHLPDDLLEELRNGAPENPATPSPATPLPQTIVGSWRELSTAAIHQAIAAHHGNIAAAARQLGISRNTLYRRLKP